MSRPIDVGGLPLAPLPPCLPASLPPCLPPCLPAFPPSLSPLPPLTLSGYRRVGSKCVACDAGTACPRNIDKMFACPGNSTSPPGGEACSLCAPGEEAGGEEAKRRSGEEQKRRNEGGRKRRGVGARGRGGEEDRRTGGEGERGRGGEERRKERKGVL